MGLRNRAPLFVGGALAFLHTLLCVATQMRWIESEGSWGWFLVFLIDFPFSIIILPVQQVLPPMIAFGVLGAVWWFFVGWLVMKIAQRVFNKRSNTPTGSDVT